MTDPNLKDAFEPFLGRGEKLLWSGRPRRGLMFRGSDIAFIPFSLVWLGMVVSMMTVMPSLGFSVFHLVLSIFFFIGLHAVFGRFLIDIIRRRNTVYGVTDKRVLILSGIFAKRLQSILLPTLSSFEVKRGRRERGAIVFGPSRFFDNLVAGQQFGMDVGAPRFEGIENVKQVGDLLRSAQRAT